MFPVKSEKIRNGSRLTTKLYSESHDSASESTFFEIDNLDTKTIEQSENNYEEIFIRFRELLIDKPWCCDSRKDVLSMCQALADNLRENLLIRKEDK
tara:strand:+ start:646 stop:936 length:291 start_codon:yes stop_codon:yes gene_type:complete